MPNIDCANHHPVQHRDGRPPWCQCCGLTKDFTIPRRRSDPDWSQSNALDDLERELAAELDAGPNDLDMPFDQVVDEITGETAAEIVNDAMLAAGVVVMAASVPVAGVPWPAVVFRFAMPDGSGFYPPMMLITDHTQMAKLSVLTGRAVDAAIKAAQ